MDDFNQNNQNQDDLQNTPGPGNGVEPNPYAQQNPYIQQNQYAQQDPNAQNYSAQPDPYSYYQPNVPEKKGLAIVSMVLGILAVVTSCFPFVSVVLGLVALILGIMVIAKKTGGKGMAIAGIVTGAIGLLFGIYMTISYMVFFNDPNYTDMLNSIMQQYQ